MDTDRTKSESEIAKPGDSTSENKKRPLRYYLAPVVFLILGVSALLAYLFYGIAGLNITGIISGVVLTLLFYYDWDREMARWLDDDEW